MNQTTKLLTDAVKNARAEQENLEQILKMTRDENFRLTLGRQYAVYNTYVQEGADMLRDAGAAVPGEETSRRAEAHLSAEIASGADRSTGHLARDVIHETKENAAKLQGSCAACPEASEGARSLASRLVEVEQRHAEEIERFL